MSTQVVQDVAMNSFCGYRTIRFRLEKGCIL